MAVQGSQWEGFINFSLWSHLCNLTKNSLFFIILVGFCKSFSQSNNINAFILSMIYNARFTTIALRTQ